jgi:protein phosphatase
MRLLPPTGKLLLCTDGLSGIVSEATMKEVMGKDIPLQQMADELFEAAMVGGGYDNITAILVDFNL